MRAYLIALLLSTVVGLAQKEKEYVQYFNSKIQNIPYVFEGRVEAVEVFAGDADGNKIPASAARWDNGMGKFYDRNGREARAYTSATISVCRQYKGDLPQQFVAVFSSEQLVNPVLITSGSDTTYSFVYIPLQHPDAERSPDILMPNPAYPVSKVFFATVTRTQNGYKMSSNYEIPMNVPTSKSRSDGSADMVTAYATLPPVVFNNQDELARFLDQIDGLNVKGKSFCDENGTKKKEDAAEDLIDNSNNAFHRAAWDKYIAERKANHIPPPLNARSLSTDLTLTMANDRMVRVGNFNWLEFDILASSNSAVYFDNCGLAFSFNTAAFGTSLVQNNNVVITRSSLFNTSSYINPQLLLSENSSGTTFDFPFGTAQASGRVQLSTTPVVMLTVRLKIQSCGQFANINFTNVNFNATQCWYTPAANTPLVNFVVFDNTSFTGSATGKTCDPIISSFTSPVPAGINQTMTINGKYFGTTKGFGTVIFKDANRGNRYPEFSTGYNNGGIQTSDVISWSDTQIQLRLPNFADSAFLPGIPPVGPTQCILGSGLFLVKNFTGFMKESTSPVSIPYSVTQYKLGPKKVHAVLAGNNGGGYRVQMNTRLSSSVGTAGKLAIKKAMIAWSCATGIDWFLAQDTAISAGTTGLDGICILDTFVTNGSAIMRTYPDPQQCNNNGNLILVLRSFDIKMKEIPSPATWELDTVVALGSNKADFYSAASHEFGHAHQVSHVNDSIVDLMWYHTQVGPVAANSRKLIKWSPNARTAGEWVADSLAKPTVCYPTHELINVMNCETQLAVGITEGGFAASGIHPNPSHGEFIVSEAGTYTVFDLLGRQVARFNLKENEILRIEQKGVFVVICDLNGKRFNSKVVVD